MSFKNKVVLVTGGSSGIGAAAAIAFTKEGANVVFVGRNEDKMNKITEKCTKVGNKPLSIKADITHEGEPERIVNETIEAFKKIDILVNNAGIIRYANILDSNFLDTYDIIMNTNLRAHMLLTHLVAPFLIKTKGNIINISSVFSKRSPTKTIMYGTSKAALNFFSRGAAAELAPYGVRVNAISPGPVESDILYNSGINKTVKEVRHEFAVPRISEPEEIADIILYLASDKAKGVTGSEYTIDNGFLLK